MSELQRISVGNLLFDPTNYRIGKQDSQKAARDAIIAEQEDKLVVLAKDIVENNLSPFDLPLVVDAQDGHILIVVEGSRRLCAIKLMLEPDLAAGTSIHAAFKRLNKDFADSIPMVLDCAIVPDKQTALVWINRKHNGALNGAGTVEWSSIAKARAQAEQGEPHLELDAVNFVLTNPQISDSLRANLHGSKFNITTLRGLLKSSEIKEAVGLSAQDGKLVSQQDRGRVLEILTEIVTAIATGEHDGKPFTQREVDSSDKRKTFIKKIASKHPEKAASEQWQIKAEPLSEKKSRIKNKKPTPSTDDQKTLIPKAFNIQLPSGKINDIFRELKLLNVSDYRHAVSVLLRVFFEISLDEYIKKHSIQLPQKDGKVIDKFQVRLSHVHTHVKESKLMTARELKPINVAIGSPDSLLAPDTLHAYVHSVWMNPDPLNLKLSWLNLHLFLERIWNSKK